MFTVSGTKVYIAPAVTAEPANAAAYAGLTWTEIKDITNLSELGDTATIVTGSIIGESRARKAKGTKDAGEFVVTVHPNDADAGQLALVAAVEAVSGWYPVKVVYPYRLTTGGTDATTYVCAVASGGRSTLGGNDDVVTRVYTLSTTTKPVNVLPT